MQTVAILLSLAPWILTPIPAILASGEMAFTPPRNP